MLKIFCKTTGYSFLIFLFLLSSCSLQQRRYRSGVYWESIKHALQKDWNNTTSKSDSNTIKTTTTQGYSPKQTGIEERPLKNQEEDFAVCLAENKKMKLEQNQATAICSYKSVHREKLSSPAVLLKSPPPHITFTILTLLFTALGLLFFGLYLPAAAYVALAIALISMVIAVVKSPKKKKEETAIQELKKPEYNKVDRTILVTFFVCLFLLGLFYVVLVLDIWTSLFGW